MRGTAAGLAVAALVVLAGCSGIVGTQGPAVDATATAPAGGEPDAEPALAFREASAEHGFTYFTTRTPRESLVANEGVYVTDYNGDGWPDILAVGGGPRLYENTGGAFEAADALPEVEGYVKVAHFLDYDADGDDDLLLFRKRAAPVALRNTGGGFERAEVGLAGAGFVVPNAVTSADYDGDGCLDLFVGQNGDWGTGAPGTDATARAVYNGTERPVITDGHQNLLFDGDCGSFSNVTREAGIATGVWGSQWTLTASFVDLTGDGHPDIHVGNDFGRDLLYVNEGDGTFRVVDAGPATDRNAMASEVADVNGDGRLDVYVTNIHIVPNMTVPEGAPISKVDIAWNPNGNNLLLNRGNGSFVDRAAEYGVRAAGFGWSAALADLDNDGHRDLLHATSTDVPITGYEERGYLQPQLWAGTPEGFDRRDATAVGFNRTNGRGLATLDFDRDGDLDVVVADSPEKRLQANLNPDAQRRTPYRLYENVGAGPNALVLRLRNPGGLTTGARVTVEFEDGETVVAANAKAGFLAQDGDTLHVGLGDRSVERLRVRWPDGTVRSYDDLPAATHLTVAPDGVTAWRPDA